MKRKEEQINRKIYITCVIFAGRLALFLRASRITDHTTCAMFVWNKWIACGCTDMPHVPATWHEWEASHVKCSCYVLWGQLLQVSIGPEVWRCGTALYSARESSCPAKVILIYRKRLIANIPLHFIYSKINVASLLVEGFVPFSFFKKHLSFTALFMQTYF